MDYANLILNIGLFVATAAATAFAWVQASAAIRAREDADQARQDAQSAVAAAERQAKAAENAVDQSDRHRRDDHRAEAVIELSQMMIDDADTAIRAIDAAAAQQAKTGPTITVLDRFRNNARYIRAQSLLVDDEAAVANWILQQSGLLHSETAMALEQHGLPGKDVGPARATAMRIATESIAHLLAWNRGQLPTQWFVPAD